jgi:septal ring factor EnvC (AmiA/AmiB activator)
MTTRYAARGIALALLIVALSPPLAAQQVRTPDENRLELERLRAQVTALEAQLADMGERRAALIDDFEAADVELALSRTTLRLVQVRLRVLSGERIERQAEVERLSMELDAAREELAARVVALYRMGPLSYSRFLLAAESTDEALANYQIVGRLASQDRSLVVSIRIRIGEHEDAVAALDETTRRLTATRAEETEAIATLTTQQDIRQELIRQIDVEAEAGRYALSEREASAAALEELLGRVSASSPSVVTSGSPDAAAATPPAFGTTRGQLPWPAEGPVVDGFGRKRHPEWNTYTQSNGIEIDAGAGNPVRAVYQGRVAYADWFQNYGLVVILSHGNDYFTIYGHLDGVRVRTGEYVDAGAEIGTVGETGSLVGPSLYFEIREGAYAVDPQAWLRRR